MLSSSQFPKRLRSNITTSFSRKTPISPLKPPLPRSTHWSLRYRRRHRSLGPLVVLMPVRHPLFPIRIRHYFIGQSTNVFRLGERMSKLSPRILRNFTASYANHTDQKNKRFMSRPSEAPKTDFCSFSRMVSYGLSRNRYCFYHWTESRLSAIPMCYNGHST